jgi:putative membrane protein
MWSVLSKAAEAVVGSEPRRQNDARGEQKEDPTVKTADTLAEKIAGKKLSKSQKKKGGVAVHYAFGAVMGGLYGLAAEYSSVVRSAAGIPYGAALFVGADEIALPLLGLSSKPTEYPLSKHLSGFGSHVVYGTTLELTRRLLRNQL